MPRSGKRSLAFRRFIEHSMLSSSCPTLLANVCMRPGMSLGLGPITIQLSNPFETDETKCYPVLPGYSAVDQVRNTLHETHKPDLDGFDICFFRQTGRSSRPRPLHHRRACIGLIALCTSPPPASSEKPQRFSQPFGFRCGGCEESCTERQPISSFRPHTFIRKSHWGWGTFS